MTEQGWWRPHTVKTDWAAGTFHRHAAGKDPGLDAYLDWEFYDEDNWPQDLRQLFRESPHCLAKPKALGPTLRVEVTRDQWRGKRRTVFVRPTYEERTRIASSARGPLVPVRVNERIQSRANEPFLELHLIEVPLVAYLRAPLDANQRQAFDALSPGDFLKLPVRGVHHGQGEPWLELGFDPVPPTRADARRITPDLWLTNRGQIVEAAGAHPVPTPLHDKFAPRSPLHPAQQGTYAEGTPPVERGSVYLVRDHRPGAGKSRPAMLTGVRQGAGKQDFVLLSSVFRSKRFILRAAQECVTDLDLEAHGPVRSKPKPQRYLGRVTNPDRYDPAGATQP